MNGGELITFLSNNFPTVMSTVGAVTGSLFTAIFLRHNTNTAEFEKVKAGQFKEIAEELLATGKMSYTEYYKANNFLSVAKKADEYYSQNQNKSNEGNYDFDWFIRFFEAVGNVSEESMQELWAKILAGEIAQPSSFSLKMIDVLKNLGKKDAELFVNICACSIRSNPQQVFLPNDDDYINSYGITYTDILRMSEHGLMFNDGTISLNIKINKNPQFLFSNNEMIMTIASISENETTASISQYPFTKVGQEIYSIIGKQIPNEGFIRYGNMLSEKKQYKFSIHRVVRWIGDSVEYDKSNLIVATQQENVD